jgi:hypothetical protein
LELGDTMELAEQAFSSMDPAHNGAISYVDILKRVQKAKTLRTDPATVSRMIRKTQSASIAFSSLYKLVISGTRNYYRRFTPVI